MIQNRIKFGALLVIVAILVSIVGCTSSGSSPAPSSSPTGASQITPSQQAQTLPPSQSAKPSTTAPSSPPAQATTIKWVGQNSFTGEYSGAVGEKFAEWLGKISGGRLQASVAPPGTYSAVADVFKNVSTGSLTFAAIHCGNYNGVIPEAEIGTIGLPFAYETPQENYLLMYKYGLYDLISKSYEKNNIKWLPFIQDMNYNLYSRTVINSINDIKGMKVRTIGSYADLMKELGASIAWVPWAETYMALKLGTVDAGCGGIGILEESKLKEVVKSVVYYPRMCSCPSDAIINMNAWKALPEDLRNLIDENYKYWGYAMGAYMHWDYEGVKVANECKKLGIKMVYFPESEANTLRTISYTKIWPTIAAKNEVCAKAIGIIKDFQKTLGKPIS